MRPFVVPRDVDDLSQCFWYHDMNLPGEAPIKGLCDMSDGYRHTIDAVPLNGRTVLEIGPASGAYTFAMEAKGATVTSVELSPDDDWDYVPHSGGVPADRPITPHVEQVQNAFWYAHRRLKSGARVYPSSVYGIGDLDMYDVGTIHAVLVHLRDPMLAMQRVAEHVRDTLVITDAEPFAEKRGLAWLRLLLRNARFMTYMPRAADEGNNHTWWHISPGLIAEHCRVLGFNHVSTRYFKAHLTKRSIPMFCVVARR